MNSKIGLWAAALLLGALSYLYYGERQRANLLGAERDALRAEKEQLSRELDDTRKSLVDAGELERLRSEQREAIKLRGELQNLKRDVASANDNAARANAAAEKAKSKAAEGAPKLVVPKVFSKQTQASLPSGQSMMMGGWETAPGKRTYAFMTPTTDPKMPNQVLVTARLAEMDLPVANQFAAMATDQNGNVTFNAEDSQALFDGFKDTAGVKVLATPRIQTISGRAGSVAVTHQMPTKEGMVNFGPEIGVTPTIAPDGKVHLVVDAKITVEGQ